MFQGEINEFRQEGGWKNLFGPIDASCLVMFRLLFGSVMFWEVCRYFSHGWIERYWIKPYFKFPYWPFYFLSPLPGDGMYYLFYGMGLLSVFIMLGFLYRLSACLFFLFFTYAFLLEETRYLNHFYLISIISFVLIFVPAHAALSLDARLFKGVRSDTAPLWSLWLLRFMIALPYFFGGVAKINPDWLQGEPLRTWFEGEIQSEVAIYFLAYGGLFFDLAVIPLLLFPKTRFIAFLFVLPFHLTNAVLFQIGIFPWFMLGATFIFLEPGFFRRLINRFFSWPVTQKKDLAWRGLSSQRFTLAALAFWAALQCFLPLRHFFIPGNVHWTEEGHKFSWHMKLRSKRGDFKLRLIHKDSGKLEVIDPVNYLEDFQLRKISGHPWLIWRFVQHIRDDFARRGIEAKIYVDAEASLNGRRPQLLIDPKVDLANEPCPYLPGTSWIIPLLTPLKESFPPLHLLVESK